MLNTTIFSTPMGGRRNSLTYKNLRRNYTLMPRTHVYILWQGVLPPPHKSDKMKRVFSYV